MKCARCKSTVSNEEQERTFDSFDDDNGLCFQCRAEEWQDDQRMTAGIPQDEGG